QRGNEVGGDGAEMIVADSGVQAEDAAGSFAVFGGFAAGFDLDGAEPIGTDPNQQEAVGGLADVEAIEQGESLIGLRAGDVRLAGGILHDSGNEVQHIAVVVGCGVGNIDDVKS